jgi:quinol monooxygenase YgiN
MTIWNFKNGQREKAFLELDRILNSLTRNSEGFRGYMSMLSTQEPNIATVLTLWQDEETLMKSEAEVFANAVKMVQDSLENSPRVENYKIYSTELFQRQ